MKHTLALLTCAVIMILTSAAESGTALEQKTQSFTIALKGSVAAVTPLFGPVREAEWAPGWAAAFHSSSGRRTARGCHVHDDQLERQGATLAADRLRRKRRSGGVCLDSARFYG